MPIDYQTTTPMSSARGYHAGAQLAAEKGPTDDQSSGIVGTFVRIGWVLLAVLGIVVPALSWPERIGQLFWLETMATWF